MKNQELLDVNAFQVLPAPTVITTTKGDILFANNSFEEIVGRSSTQLTKLNIADLLHEDDIPGYRQVTTLLCNAHSKVQFKPRFIVGHGVVPVVYLASCLTDHEKKETYILVQVIQLDDPITVAETLNNTKACRNTEKSNNELAEFAYIVSHDLKAPLRAIVNLADWIDEDLKDGENDEVKENLRLMKGRVGRMEKLIDGVLQYSRVNRELHVREEVDVSQVLAQSIEALAVPSGFQVHVPATLPVVMYSKKDLDRVFTNLLSNSIRHHDKSRGTIQIDYVDENNLHAFSISDDGPGIGPEFHDKIFKIFQTLQPRDTMESSGVGLTIAKKIVEGRGGTMTVESVPGEGAKFIFTIPKQATNII